jgi:CheY-like chemotaxis protein
VQDTGLGMTAEEQEKLFQPFTQASANTDKQYGGTGLGLSISKKLVKLLGGRIHVTSTLNKGSTFTFSIQSKLIKHQVSPLLSPKLLGKKIILISERSPQYKPLLKQLRRWQAEVYLFNNQQAEQHISNTREPDLLFIDSHMLNNSAEKWNKLCDTNSHCQLIILEDLKSELIAPDIYKGGFFVNTPLLPYQLLNIIDSIFNTGTASKLAENTVKKIDQPNKYSILVVDDNEINQIVAAGLLEALPVEIKTASNGQEALDILNNTSTTFDLILMDCQMPIMDGFAATEAIRQGKAGYENSKISIIAMTAGAMSGDKDACLQSGMNDFIIKPLDGINFRSKVSSWLESQ